MWGAFLNALKLAGKGVQALAKLKSQVQSWASLGILDKAMKVKADKKIAEKAGEKVEGEAAETPKAEAGIGGTDIPAVSGINWLHGLFGTSPDAPVEIKQGQPIGARPQGEVMQTPQGDPGILTGWLGTQAPMPESQMGQLAAPVDIVKPRMPARGAKQGAIPQQFQQMSQALGRQTPVPMAQNPNYMDLTGRGGPQFQPGISKQYPSTTIPSQYTGMAESLGQRQSPPTGLNKFWEGFADIPLGKFPNEMAGRQKYLSTELQKPKGMPDIPDKYKRIYSNPSALQGLKESFFGMPSTAGEIDPERVGRKTAFYGAGMVGDLLRSGILGGIGKDKGVDQTAPLKALKQASGRVAKMTEVEKQEYFVQLMREYPELDPKDIRMALYPEQYATSF